MVTRQPSECGGQGTPEPVLAVDDIIGRWDHSSLPDNVSIGSGCFLEKRSSFSGVRSARRPGLVMGDRVRVYSWTVFNVELGGLVEVGSDTILVGAAVMCQEHIRIGARVIVSYRVMIADSDFHPLDPDARKLDAVANAPGGDLATRPAFGSRPVHIDDGAWIGIGAVILKGVTIGKDARIHAGAVVSFDVPAGAEVAGNPGRIVSR
jgi:acetyltransferase-like isoleucine patch superfamily enzyme